MDTHPKTDDDALLNDIEAFLRSAIETLTLEPEHSPRAGRPRILPALCLWAGLMVCVLRGMHTQSAIHRLLTQRGLWSYPRFALSDEAIYKRLANATSDPLQRLFKHVSALMATRIAPYVQQRLAPFASGVYVLDVMTLDKAARLLPTLDKSVNATQQLPGKLAAVFNVRAQQWHHVQHVVSSTENDKRSAEDLLTTIPTGALVLADMGYFSFRWFDDLTDNGYWWLSRMRERTSYEVLHTFYQQGDTLDAVIWLGAYRADKAKHAVRLVTFRHGQQLHRYITNVLDPCQFSIQEVAEVYARRWDIEMAFKLIKRDLKLHLLWSRHTSVVLHQVWAALTIAQILMGLRVEIAGRADVDPFDVSLPLLVEYFPAWGRDGADVMALFVDGRSVGFIRPSCRIRIDTPFVPPTALVPLPPTVQLTRTPRYAGRRC